MYCYFFRFFHFLKTVKSFNIKLGTGVFVITWWSQHYNKVCIFPFTNSFGAILHLLHSFFSWEILNVDGDNHFIRKKSDRKSPSSENQFEASLIHLGIHFTIYAVIFRCSFLRILLFEKNFVMNFAFPQVFFLFSESCIRIKKIWHAAFLLGLFLIFWVQCGTILGVSPCCE